MEIWWLLHAQQTSWRRLTSWRTSLVRAFVDGISDVAIDTESVPSDAEESLGAVRGRWVRPRWCTYRMREELCAIVCDGLEETLDSDGDWSKIAECTHWLLLGAVPKGVDFQNQNRTWLWAIKDRVQPCLASHDYTLAVRTPDGSCPLRLLWRHLLDAQGNHALCCMGRLYRV